MNPLLQAALGSLVRWGLAFLAGYLVNHGIWTQADADSYIAAASLTLVGLIWALWNNYRGRLRFLTALQAPPGTSEQDVKTIVAEGLGAKP